jgi:superfamily II DNA or RNA helicase
MKEEIQNHNGDGPAFVLFDIDCGQGKTTKTLEMIGDDGGACLYLVPRSSLLKSIENKCAEQDLGNVTPMTMQTFVTLPDAVLRLYKWVVVDECQQCILDSAYNKGIVQVYRKLARAFNGTACIMLTGTDVGVAEHFKNWYGIDVLVYRNKEKRATWLQGDAFGFVPNIDTVIDIICRKLAKNEKVLFFSSNIKNIDYVSEMVPAKTMAVVSRGNADAVRLCGRKRKNVNKLIDDEAIPEGISVVCATKCLDTGVNIKSEDGSLTTIIIDELCVASALQEINRFRREEDAKIDLYFLLPRFSTQSHHLICQATSLSFFSL